MSKDMSEATKPKCRLVGEDGNIFNLMGLASKALKKNGQPEAAKKMCEAVQKCGSYDEALNLLSKYVEVV